MEAKRFASYALDQGALEGQLANAPLEGRGEAVVVRVPAPSGRLEPFEVRESPVLEPGIAAENPQIKTYAGRGVDEPGASIRLSLTPLGFNASVLSERGAWYVDPYSYPERGVYASYWKRNLPAAARNPLIEEEELPNLRGKALGDDVGEAAQDVFGERPARRGGNVVQRIYRTAIANDPAYAAFFGGGDANVLAAKTALINRVNQIYNDDLAVKLVLIDETNALNFETLAEYSQPNGPCGAAPCYTADAGCGSELLYDNTVTLGQVVGASEFDVGHVVLGVEGGGIAGLGVVGGPRKAAGCTGTPQPVNDPFAVDYVAHEFGHQFGSNHTFNGVEGSCGNRVAQTSVEPGSGSTVMGYAGICGADNLQPLSDPYFSQRSIEVITDYVSSSQPNVDEIQTASFTGFGASDSFRVGYNGQNSAVITNGANYTKAGIKSAIESITGWPAGASVIVYGYEATADDPSPAGFQVYFGGTLAGVDVSALSIESPSGFTGFVGETAQGGSAANAGTVNPTANTPPVVTAPADETIPVRTPFELVGTGTDSDGDPLVYTWEQNDQGVGPGTALLSNTKPNGPLFRFASVATSGESAATSSPSRVFPDLAQIAAGDTNAATGTCGAGAVDCFSEFLPTPAYASAMNFRLTARDRNAEGGGVSSDDVTLTLADGAGPFRVTSHASAATLQGNSSVQVTWDVAGTNAAPVSASDVSISFSDDGGLTYPSELAAATPNDGSHTVTVPNLDTTEGRFRVQAVGNVFFDISDADLTVEPGGPDTTPPDTTITSGPAEGATTNDATPEFVFSSTEGGSTFECQIDGGGFAACTSPHTTTPLANGSHTFQVRATDAAGNTDGSPATRTFTVDTTSPDTTPPETTITSGPAEGSTITGTTPEFGFSSNEGGSTFECKVDGGTFSGCNSPQEIGPLSNGSHTFSVRATDPAGNIDDSPASRTFTVDTGGGGDTTPPETTILSAPQKKTYKVKKGKKAKVVYEYGSNETPVTYECNINNTGWQACFQATRFTLGKGTWTLQARAVDAAGNVDATPVSDTIVVKKKKKKKK